MLQPNASGERTRLLPVPAALCNPELSELVQPISRPIDSWLRQRALRPCRRRFGAHFGAGGGGICVAAWGRRLVPTATSPVTGVATHGPEMVSNLVARLEALGIAPRRGCSPRRLLSPTRGLLRQRTGCARPDWCGERKDPAQCVGHHAGDRGAHARRNTGLRLVVSRLEHQGELPAGVRIFRAN